MKKIINAPERFIPEMLEGIYAAHPDELMCVGGDLHCLVSKRKHAGKVGIATGGGSGHLPLFLGYVGEGMLDGCSIGDVFQSPSAEQMLAVTKEIDQGAGVLYIYGNYNGDIFNFDMAAEMADMEEDIRVESVVAGEDVASAGPSAEGEPNKRRGVAGIFFVYKCAGAAAAAGLDLDEVKRVAEKACANVRTMGVALTSCTVPRVGHPSFEIGDDEMEIGMGIHGRAGHSPRQAASCRRDRGRDAHAHSQRPALPGRRRGGRAHQRPGCDPIGGAVRDVPPRQADAGRKRHPRLPHLCGRVCHLHGDGGRFDFAHPPG